MSLREKALCENEFDSQENEPVRERIFIWMVSRRLVLTSRPITSWNETQTWWRHDSWDIEQQMSFIWVENTRPKKNTYSKIILTPWERFSFVSARPFFNSTHVFLLWSDNSGSYREITARKEVGNFIDNSITFFVFFFFLCCSVCSNLLCCHTTLLPCQMCCVTSADLTLSFHYVTFTFMFRFVTYIFILPIFIWRQVWMRPHEK